MKIASNLDFAAAARAVNLLDPAAAQDAATKAYADGLLGWKDLALVTPGSINAVDFDPLSQAYGDLRLVFEGLSHNGGSSQQLTLAVKDAAGFSAAVNVIAAQAGAATICGAIEIPGYRGEAGGMVSLLAGIASSPALAAGGAAFSPAWRCAGGIQGLRVGFTGGATFDGGKLRLQARR